MTKNLDLIKHFRGKNRVGDFKNQRMWALLMPKLILWINLHLLPSNDHGRKLMRA